MQEMGSLGRETVEGIKSFLELFASIQGNSIVSYQIFLDQMNSDISTIDGLFDSESVLRGAKANSEIEPDDFQFIPCGLWKEGVRTSFSIFRLFN
jgi:hypothetical protein